MPVARPRLGALDLLRGVTVAGMIVVNNPGNWSSVFPQLLHAPWHGVTAADLIFPAFIFIMGVAMSLALASSAPAGTRAQVYKRILKRAGLLVLLGLVLNAAAAWPHVGAMRIPGVLQRIGLTYLAAAVITLDATVTQQWMISSGLLMVHWALLIIPFGPASGHLEPGRNIAASIDRSLFGSHILSPAGDPEGALGLLSSIATALLGSAAGRWLLRARSSAGGGLPTRELVWKLALAGTCGLVVAWAWAAILPLNKSLWTPSFAVLTSGVATLCLVGAALLDQSPMRSALAPFFWLGTNPLAVYFLSELTTDLIQVPWFTVGGHHTAPKDWFFWGVLAPRVGDSGGAWSSVIYALLYALMWIGVAGMMRWRRIRFRV